MAKNPILEELYAVRSQIQAEYGDQLSDYLHSEFERLKAEGHPVAHVEQRSVRGNETPGANASVVANHSSQTAEQ